jgi:hypothetical protein
MFGTFFTLTATDTDAIIGYAGAVISDCSPLLLIIVGVSVGILILYAITNSAKK